MLTKVETYPGGFCPLILQHRRASTFSTRTTSISMGVYYGVSFPRHTRICKHNNLIIHRMFIRDKFSEGLRASLTRGDEWFHIISSMARRRATSSRTTQRMVRAFYGLIYQMFLLFPSRLYHSQSSLLTHDRLDLT